MFIHSMFCLFAYIYSSIPLRSRSLTRSSICSTRIYRPQSVPHFVIRKCHARCIRVLQIYGPEIPKRALSDDWRNTIDTIFHVYLRLMRRSSLQAADALPIGAQSTSHTFIPFLRVPYDFAENRLDFKLD